MYFTSSPRLCISAGKKLRVGLWDSSPAATCWPLPGCAGVAGLFLLVLQNEYNLAGTDQSQLLARKRLDGGRILVKTADFIAETRVLAFQILEGAGELLIFMPGAHRFQQPLLAGERVDDQHERDEPDQQVHAPPAPGRLVGGGDALPPQGLDAGVAPGPGFWLEDRQHGQSSPLYNSFAQMQPIN